MSDKCEVEMRTKNKLTMEFAVEHVEAMSKNIAELHKKNKVRTCKRETLPREFLGSSGVALTSCGRGTNEVIIAMYSSSRGTAASRCIKHENPTK